MNNPPLDGQHSQNFLMMLRSMKMQPFSPAGVMMPGVLPAPNQPMTPEGAMAEAGLFAAQAYGATLGLCYYRSLGDTLRKKWDDKIQESIDDCRKGMTADFATAQSAWRKVIESRGQNPAARAEQAAVSTSVQNKRKKLDFMIALQSKKQSTFSGSSGAAINDPKKVGQNPWCQSDSEFRQAVAQEVGATNPQAVPSFNYGMDGKKREATARETTAKVLTTILTSKITTYLDKFLEYGEEKLPGLLAHGIGLTFTEVTHKIPIVDLIIDWIKDKVAEKCSRRAGRELSNRPGAAPEVGGLEMGGSTRTRMPPRCLARATSPGRSYAKPFEDGRGERARSAEWAAARRPDWMAVLGPA